jgi:hypothetical protein
MPHAALDRPASVQPIPLPATRARRRHACPGRGARAAAGVGARLATLVLLVLAAAGCARRSSTVVVAATPGPATDPASSASSNRGSTARDAGWNLDAREHVDLWLHGFALLQDDASLVPYFRPGYRATLSSVRPATGGTLEANRAQLQQRLASTPSLVSAQFLALYFASWDDLRRGVERFLRDQGEVRAARTQDELRMYATIRTYFPTADDREWLRLFVLGLDDERARFFRGWWLQEQQRRADVRATVEQLWTQQYRGAFVRFMRNSMQREGLILLSVVLGGEGRTLAVGGRDNFVTVTFPSSTAEAAQAMSVVAHEAVGTVANAAVRDQSSAAEQRSGDADRWQTLAAVRGGALLLQRVAPDLVAGYQRYYLSLARVAVPAGDPTAAFVATFPLPDRIVTALDRQIEMVLGGI